MSLGRQVAINFIQEHGRLVDNDQDIPDAFIDRLGEWFDGAYAAERERCAGVLGKEVLRLLGCRDREDAEGIARAAKLVRESSPCMSPAKEPKP